MIAPPDRTEQAKRAASTLMVGFHDLVGALATSASGAASMPISDDELARVQRLLEEFDRLLAHCHRFADSIARQRAQAR